LIFIFKTINSMEVGKDYPECSIVKTTSINYTPLIDFVIRAALHFVFPASCALNLYINHWTICMSIIEQLQELWKLRVKLCMTIKWHLSFFMGTSVQRVPNMINYIFSTHWQLSNGKLARNKVLCQWLSEGYCDHSTVTKAHRV
jgi:hypothetical protein